MEQPERYDLVPTLNDLGRLKNFLDHNFLFQIRIILPTRIVNIKVSVHLINFIILCPLRFNRLHY